MRVDRGRRAFDIDRDSEDLDRRSLQAVDRGLSRASEARRLALQLANFTGYERDDQKHKPSHGDDDHDKDDRDRQYARHTDGDQARNGRLHQKCDCGAQHERAKEVAQQIQHDDRDEKRNESEGDLEVPATPLRIERQGRYHRRSQRGGLNWFALVGSPLLARTHVTQSPQYDEVSHAGSQLRSLLVDGPRGAWPPRKPPHEVDSWCCGPQRSRTWREAPVRHREPRTRPGDCTPG